MLSRSPREKILLVTSNNIFIVAHALEITQRSHPSKKRPYFFKTRLGTEGRLGAVIFVGLSGSCERGSKRGSPRSLRADDALNRDEVLVGAEHMHARSADISLGETPALFAQSAEHDLIGRGLAVEADLRDQRVADAAGFYDGAFLELARLLKRSGVTQP